LPVGALLLNWRQAALTTQCLQDLLAALNVSMRVLVMDNGSGDGSAEVLQAQVGTAAAKGAPVEFVAFADNLGFCAAMNRGIAWARERGLPLVLLLNNDLRLPPDFLAPMVSVLQHDARAMAVGPTILQPDGRVWSQGGSLGFHPNTLKLNGHGQQPMPTGHGPEAVDFLPGTCLLLRRGAVEAVGGIDEEFFMYWEDVDLCRKLRERGGTCIWLPWVQVVHQGTVSSGGGRSPLRKYLMALNGVRYLKRAGSASQWAAFVLLDLLLWPLLLLSNERPAAFAKLRGMVAGLRGRRASRADVERYVAR
jgi:GT2 family glycosyltransferase